MLTPLVSFLVFVGALVLIHGIVRGLLFWMKTNSRFSLKDWCTELGLIIVITLAITLTISFALNYFGVFESFFFRPSKRDFGEIDKFSGPKSVLTIQNAATPELNAWLFKTEMEPIGLVVHFHGSDRNISFTARNSHWLTEHGFHVLAFDYRGYGVSEGKPTRVGVVEDGVAALEKAREVSSEMQIPVVVWGQSMGGQVAILAARETAFAELKGVVAEATYGSPRMHVCQKMAGMGPLGLLQWAAWSVISNKPNAEDALSGWDFESVPLLIVTGTEDQGVSPEQSKRLYLASRNRASLWQIPGAGHLKVFQEEENRLRLSEQFRTWCQAQRTASSEPTHLNPP